MSAIGQRQLGYIGAVAQEQPLRRKLPQNKQERTLSVLSAGARVLLARERERARVRESSISVAERGKKQDTPYCQALHGRMEASMAM